MIIHDINNNILVSGTSSSCGYQDIYENLELCKEINICFGLEPNRKNDKTVVRFFLSILGINLNQIAHLIFEWVMSVVG